MVDKKYSDGHELNYQSVVRNDENAKPGSIVWQGKIVFNKNIEKYADFKSSISNNNTNYFSYVNRDVTVETKIIGSTTLKGEDVKLTKRALLNYNNTTVNGSAAEFNTNNDVSRFSGAITISKNNPIKAGDKIKFSMHEDSSIRFIDKDFPVGTKLWFSKSREGISSSTPVNKYGVYFAGGPSIEFKIISRSDSEIIIEAMNNSAPIDGVYGAWISSIKVIDGSMVKNGVISGVKYTVEAIAKDGKVINKRDFNQNASIYGSNVETYAKIRRPEAKPQKPAPAPTPAQPQPAVETPKAEKPSEGKVQAPNTGFEKSQNFIILAFAILGVTTAVVFRKKLAKIKI